MTACSTTNIQDTGTFRQIHFFNYKVDFLLHILCKAFIFIFRRIVGVHTCQGLMYQSTYAGL